MMHRLIHLGTIGLSIMLVLNIAYAFSATVTVPSATNVKYMTHAITTSDLITSLKPPECSSINPTVLVIGSGTINYSQGASALILGSAGDDTISGGGGADCILGGAGNDIINGRGGNNILLGGPGSDSLTQGQVCYGGPGNQSGDTDTFSNCNTIVQ